MRMKISYISGICVEHDAISNVVFERMEALRSAGMDDLRLYAYECTRDLPFVRVRNYADVLLDPHFQASDLVVFHFGIYYPLMNLLPLVPRSAKRLVVFHNITPRELVSPESQEVIDKSFAQMSNLLWADYIACDSMANLRVLRDAGIHTLAGIMPLPVRMMAPAPQRKPSFDDDRTRIVFLGRLVRSKGPHELLQAMRKILAAEPACSMDLDMIANLALSDKAIVEEVHAVRKELEKSHPGRIRIQLHGNVTETQKEEILRAADLFVLPTKHEGFCIPILEALACGCRVITYENSNTPFISGGLARLISTGDVDALADAILDEANRVHSRRWQMDAGPESYCHFALRAAEYVSQYSPEITNDRFIRMAKTWVEDEWIPHEFIADAGSGTIRMPVKNVSVVSPTYLLERPEWIKMLSSRMWLGESEPCLGEGWLEPESWPPRLRHSGKRARIYLQKPDSRAAQLRIRAFQAYEVYSREPIQLTVSLWGRPIGSQPLKFSVWTDLFFPILELPQYPFLNLELSVNKTWIPDRIHHNGDLRELGIAVHFIGVETD
jgi:glycosyltransferase involved in cell wall biosynthesis